MPLYTDEDLETLMQLVQEEVDRAYQSPPPEAEPVQTPDHQAVAEKAEEKAEELKLNEELATQFYENLQVLEEANRQRLAESETATETPWTPPDPLPSDTNVAAVDNAILAAGLVGVQAWEAMQDFFDPSKLAEPNPVETDTDFEEEATEPLKPVQPEPGQSPSLEDPEAVRSVEEPEPEEPEKAAGASFFPNPLEEGLPTSAEERHDWAYEGIGDFGTIMLDGTSSEQAMAEASLRENQQFKAEQAALDEAIAAETDPDRKAALELRQDIEVAEYTASCYRETARVESALAGDDLSPSANQALGRAEEYEEQAEALWDEWSKRGVRDAENYPPRDDEMAQTISEHREREEDEWSAFNEQAEKAGWSPERRQVEEKQFQAALDHTLDMSFGSPSPSLSTGMAM